jgi:hypothetical protein
MKVQGELTREDIALIEKREEMNRQFTDGTYSTLVKVIADWTGKAIQRITRGSKSLPFWYNLTVIILSVQVKLPATHSAPGGGFGAWRVAALPAG